MTNYTLFSLETHLFFARIMKEHSLFLEAVFACVDEAWIQRADWFRREFENFHRDIVRMSNGNVIAPILNSGELVTQFTIPAEERTAHLTGIPIDSRISRMEQALRPGNSHEDSPALLSNVRRMNRRSLSLLNGLIEYKEALLSHVRSGNLFNANYPLLIEHILREARLYRTTIQELESGKPLTYQNLCETETFWNRIMMEHALFIRGLLDPSEETLIGTADTFAKDYQKLLEMARQQDCKATDALAQQSLEETKKYRQFKAAGTAGILSTEIASIILPLLADHVLREANHYIRLLETA